MVSEAERKAREHWVALKKSGASEERIRLAYNEYSKLKMRRYRVMKRAEAEDKTEIVQDILKVDDERERLKARLDELDQERRGLKKELVPDYLIEKMEAYESSSFYDEVPDRIIIDSETGRDNGSFTHSNLIEALSQTNDLNQEAQERVHNGESLIVFGKRGNKDSYKEYLMDSDGELIMSEEKEKTGWLII